MFHNHLYHYDCLEEVSLPKPDLPPYYPLNFFETIKKAFTQTPLNPIHMTLKQWYNLLLEAEVTMEVMGEGSAPTLKKTRLEMLYPEHNWASSYLYSRLTGVSTEVRSFNFKLLNQLLPVSARLSRLLPNNRDDCQLCQSGESESIQHALGFCDRNNDAAQAILSLTRPYDPSVNLEKVLHLEFNFCDPIYELPAILIVSTGFHYIWHNRVNKKGTALYQIRAEIECLISLFRRSRLKK